MWLKTLVEGLLIISNLSFWTLILNENSDNVNQSQYKDPDIGKSAQQMILARGFQYETHFIQTEDGYILTVIRMINHRFKQTKRPVLLYHGLLSSANSFLMNSYRGNIDEKTDDENPGNSIGFELAKRGYDVWLANGRGNMYSRMHVEFNPQSPDFWNFSLDEFIKYDAPATIDFIVNHTQKSEIAFIGLSQGATILLGLMATEPRFNDIIAPFIALAPVVNIKKGPRVMDEIAKNRDLIQWYGQQGGKIFDDELAHSLVQLFCTENFAVASCLDIYSMTAGHQDPSGINVTRLVVYEGDNTSDSKKSLAHWAQQYVYHGNLRYYDYGMKGNLERYGQSTPPEYPFHKITNPNIALYWTLNDAVTGPDEIKILMKSMNGTTAMDTYSVMVESFSHIDFLISLRAGELVNNRIIKTLQLFEEGGRHAVSKYFAKNKSMFL